MKRLTPLLAALPLALFALSSCDAPPETLANTVWVYEETRPDNNKLSIEFAFDKKYLTIKRAISGSGEPYSEEEIANYSYRMPNLKIQFGIGTEATGVATASQITTTEQGRNSGETHTIIFKRKQE
jgi:hypothetical protein